MSSLERIEEIVASVLRVPRDGVSKEKKLSDLAPLDSLSLVEVLSAIDDAFDVRMPSDSITTVTTIAELADNAERAPKR